LAERPSIRVRVAADTKGLARVSDVYEAFSRQNKIPDTIRRDVYVALEEIVSNVFRHGSRRRKAHISLTLAIERGAFRVEIVDDGPPFDPFSAPAPDTTQPLHDRPIGGLGILFVNNLTDEHSYARTRGHNRVTLVRGVRLQADRQESG
jgi:serine/threonine-protein kinase RsbW